MRRPIVRFLGLAGGTVGSVAGMATARAQDELTCAVNLSIKNEVAEFRGFATSKAGGQGRYRLVVSKVGRAGTSNMVQSGQVMLEPGGLTGVGSVNISVEVGSRYEAALTLEVGGTHRECRAGGVTDL